MTDNSPSKYKWYILALGVATHIFVCAMPQMCMPVLFKEISDDLGLGVAQLGVVWGMVGLSGLFTALAYGLIGDRYGTRLTLGVACLLQGIFGALRGLSGGFISLAIYMFLFGLSTVPLSFTVHKTTSEWFSGRQLGFANGVLAMGMGVGATLTSMISATVLSPLLGGWRNIMFVYGAVAIVVSLLWLQTRHPSRQAETSTATGTVLFRQALSHVIHIKSLWFLALTGMCVTGCSRGLVGYLPYYLRESGWTAGNADGALAALAGAGTLGVIPLSFLSDRIGLRKAVLYPAITVTILGVGLLSVFSGAVVWPLVVLVGIVREFSAAMQMTMIMETTGVGAAYAGTALGLRNTFGQLGGFISPSIGNRLAEINPSFAFIFWSALSLAALFFFSFVKETGWKRRITYLAGDVS